MNIFKIAGTANRASFPFGEGCGDCPTFCTGIARDLPNGTFKLGNPLVPSLSTTQKEGLSDLDGMTAAEFAALEDPVILWTSYVPTKHWTTDLVVEVEPDVTEFCLDRTCCSTDPAGMTFSVVAVKFDSAAYAESSSCSVEDFFDGSPEVIDAAFANVDAATASWDRIEFDETVGVDEGLLIGIQIDSLPTNGNVSCVKNRITPVLNVHSSKSKQQVA